MFGRKRFDRALRERGVPPEVAPHVEEDREPTSGPWDIRDVPDPDRARLDLGAIQIPVDPAFEVRLEVSGEGALNGVTLVRDGSLMQLGVFAAPRSGGLWSSLRDDITEEIEKNKGSIKPERTEFGTELVGVVKTDEGDRPTRFIGVDGPRWFLRALIAGPAAADEQQLDAFRDTIRACVVNRGTEPKPVREPLTLQLPPEVAKTAAEDVPTSPESA